MKKRVLVSQIMTKNLVLLNVNDTLEKAEGLFKKHNIRHIPVVNNKKIEGILSYSDLSRLSIADVVYEDKDYLKTSNFKMLSLKQVMAKSVTTVQVSDTIYAVAKILASDSFHALPVEKDGKLVGIVTTTDLIKYILQQY